MIDLSTRAQSLEHWIRLNAEFRSDLAWWTLFVERWNGVSSLSIRFTTVGACVHRQQISSGCYAESLQP